MGSRTKSPIFFLLVFLLPAFLIVTIFVLYPIVDTIYISLLDKGTGEFVGLDNYATVVNRKDFLNTERLQNFWLGPSYGGLIHNILWIAIHLPLCVFFGLLLSVLLRDIKEGAIIKSIIFLGMVVPLVIGGVLIRFSVDPDAGILNGLLRIVGLGAYVRDPTIYPNTALLSVILGSVWIWVGFSMIVYSAGLQGIPVELYEAAQIDGASRWRTFWRITVPMLRSATLVVVTMTLLWELKVFDIVYVVTQGGPGYTSTVLAYLMFSEAFPPGGGGNFGIAAAISTILTILTLVFAAYLVKRMAES